MDINFIFASHYIYIYIYWKILIKKKKKKILDRWRVAEKWGKWGQCSVRLIHLEKIEEVGPIRFMWAHFYLIPILLFFSQALSPQRVLCSFPLPKAHSNFILLFLFPNFPFSISIYIFTLQYKWFLYSHFLDFNSTL